MVKEVVLIVQKILSSNKYIAIGVILILLAAAAFCVSGGNNDGTAGSGGNQTEQIRNTQTAITSGLTNAEQSAGNISTGIDRSQTAISNAQSAAGRIEANLEESGKLIKEIRGILQEVRSAEKQTGADRIQPES